jgi:peptidoglycan/xylan/chitin deacetylase (PgdA/CDA1 family)
MKLVITIDTEEDNWGRYSTTDNPVENIERIAPLQLLFDEFGIKPTYLVTYPVATNHSSVAILRRILDEGKCEIGAHCHPWNTPPFEEKLNGFNSMLCNLPEPMVHRKLTALHDAICSNFGVAPASFRAGRWGFGPAVARSIHRLGYRIDTSVTPFVSWKHYQGPDFTNKFPPPYRFNAKPLNTNEKNGAILEVPVTIGFLQSRVQMSRQLDEVINRPLSIRLYIPSILIRLRLLNKVWLSPEMADANSMIKLAKQMQKNGLSCLNMTFHSTSLLSGLSPFVRTKTAQDGFIKKIRKFFVFARAEGWESMTLAQFETKYMNSERGIS